MEAAGTDILADHNCRDHRNVIVLPVNNRKMKRIFNSPYLPIVGYVFAVGFNLPHMVEAYHRTGLDLLPAWYPWVMFLIVDFGILILALKNHTWGALIFACMVFMMTLYVFWEKSPIPDDPYWPGFIYFMPGLFISSIPGFFVFYLSELISRDVFDMETRDLQLEQYRTEAETSRKELALLRTETETMRNDSEAIRNELAQARTESETMRNELAHKRKELESLGKASERDRKELAIIRQELALLTEHAGKKPDTLRKAIKARRDKIAENGISREDREKLEAEIRAMEIAQGK